MGGGEGVSACCVISVSALAISDLGLMRVVHLTLDLSLV